MQQNVSPTDRLLRFLLVAFCSSLARGATQHSVEWTPDGVQKRNRTITVEPGDDLTFRCPKGSFSTTWFMSDLRQYENCDCEMGPKCILISNCEYIFPNNFSTAIQRTSENLQDTPDYQPGQTYYFASFSVNSSSLTRSSEFRSGGECSRHMLRLQLKVLDTSTDEDVGEGPPPSSLTTTDPEGAISREPPVDSSNDDSTTKPEVGGPESLQNSPSLPISLSHPLILTLSLLTLFAHFLV